MARILYRRRVALALLQALGRRTSKTEMQKYLFLLSQQQESPAYDFVPYKYGCFSSQADADRKTLVDQGYLTPDESWTAIKDSDFISELRPDDKSALRNVTTRFGDLRGSDLVRWVYIEFPFFATRSEVAGEVLTGAEQEVVRRAVPKSDLKALYTVGSRRQDTRGLSG